MAVLVVSSRALEVSVKGILCLIIMEALSRLIEKAISVGLLTGFAVSRMASDPLLISHILFADDTLIFCEADPVHISHLRYILIWFEATSGLRVNLGKSANIFSISFLFL